jgi:hypothetical protein
MHDRRVGAGLRRERGNSVHWRGRQRVARRGRCGDGSCRQRSR